MGRTWRLFSGLAVLCAACVGGSARSEQTLGEFYSRVITPVITSKTAILLSDCDVMNYEGGSGTFSNLIYFPVGQRDGVFLQFTREHDDYSMMQGVALPFGAQIDTNAIMGGEPTQAYELRIIRRLLRGKFRLVQPEDIQREFMTAAKGRCVMARRPRSHH